MAVGLLLWEWQSHQSNEWGGEDHGGDCSFLRIYLLCYLVSEVLLYLSAMLLRFWSPTIWLKKAPTMTFLLSNLPVTSKISTKSLGTHCLPACSAIAGTCLSSWFCYPLAMMTLRRCWSPICGIGFSPLKFLSSSESGSLSCLLFRCQQSWVNLLVHRVGYFWKWLKSLRGRCKSGYTDFVRKIACVNDCA